MTEITLSLNVYEIGILLSALQNLENADELRLARESMEVFLYCMQNFILTGSEWTLRKLDYGMMWCPHSEVIIQR